MGKPKKYKTKKQAYKQYYLNQKNKGLRKKHQDNWILRKYKIDKLPSKDDRCEICHEQAPINKRLHIDHNHSTGQTRGFLCVRCNTRLGFLENPPVSLFGETFISQAKLYIEKYDGKINF